MTTLRKRTGLAVGLAALAFALASCVSDSPQDSLDPHGPYAEKIDVLFRPVAAVAIAVFLLVEGGIFYLLWRYRHHKGREQVPPQIHGNTRMEIAWTIVPFLILTGVAVPTVATIFDLAARPTGNVLNVTVEGHQWWWGFKYTDPDMQLGDGKPLGTANILVIPTGRPVYVSLESVGELIGDKTVIHSFWVPELAGKQDVVPNQTNHLTLEADTPGTYYGQCLEFCGLSHANMKFRVIAMAPADFDAWVTGQKEDQAVPTGGMQASGFDLFSKTCIACHTVRGAAPGGAAAPDLTHFASRECLAGCMVENTEENLVAWLRDPPARKPGSFMPDYNLTDGQIDALVAYLETLH